MGSKSFFFRFSKNKVGVDGLNVVFDIERISRLDGTRIALATGASQNIAVGRRGIYGYLLENNDDILYNYVITAITSSVDVDEQEISPFLVSENILLTASDVWSYGARVLTDYVINSQKIIKDSKIELYNYTDNVVIIQNVADSDEIYFTVKSSKKNTDAQSIIQITKTGGLVYLNGAPVATSATLHSTDGSIVPDGNGNLVVTLTALAASYCVSGSVLSGDVKTKVTSGKVSLSSEFDVIVIDTVTHTIT